MNRFEGEEKDRKVAQLREKFAEKNTSSSRFAKFDQRDVCRINNDDLYALSFIHWKKGDLDLAVKMASDVLGWRADNKVTDLSVSKIGDDFFTRGICYLHGRDKNGHRIMAMIGRLQTKDTKEQSKKLFTFWLERLQRNEPGQHITFILDCGKTGMSNVDLGLIRYIIDSFTTYFPDLLERIIILDMPWIMNAIWNIVKQWMTEEQRNRTVFCSTKDLTKMIELDQLPKTMGGADSWQYSFPPFPDELSQEHDFLKDPNNFPKSARMENGEASRSEDEEAEKSPANGDVKKFITENGNLNNNSIEDDVKNKEGSVYANKKVSPVKRKHKNDSNMTGFEAKAAKSSLNGSETTMVENFGKLDGDLDYDSSTAEGPAVPEKVQPADDSLIPSNEEDVSKSPVFEKEDSETVKYNSVRERGQSPDRIHSNVSFQSLKEDRASPDASPTKSDLKMGTNEIVLSNLLIMSPVSELLFSRDPNSSKPDRLEAFINIRNPNDDFEKRLFVAYKIKTTSPERYHVKPSVGFLAPGASVQIRIYVGPGYETTALKDRFLLLYKQLPILDNKSPSHSEVVKFWRKHSDKLSHSEHKLRVKLESSQEPEQHQQTFEQNKKSVTEQNDNSKHQLMSKRPLLSSTSLPSFLGSSTELDEESDYMKLERQVAFLNKKMARLENDTRWMKRRMRHAMGLLLIIIFLICLVFYEIISLSYQIETRNSCSAPKSGVN